MRKILLIIGGVAILGGGGAGAYFMFFQKPAEASLTDIEPAGGEAQAATTDGHGDDHGKDSGPPAPTFVKLDPLVIPMMDGEGISQIIALDVTFEVADDAAKTKFEQLKPRLRDAMIQSMYGLLNHQTAMENGALRVGYVKERLNTVATNVLGPDQVKDVLLQMVQQNPI